MLKAIMQEGIVLGYGETYHDALQEARYYCECDIDSRAVADRSGLAEYGQLYYVEITYRLAQEVNSSGSETPIVRVGDDLTGYYDVDTKYPFSPEVLMNARQDTVHKDLPGARAAKVVRLTSKDS